MSKQIIVNKSTDYTNGSTSCALVYDVKRGTYRSFYNDLFDYEGKIVRCCKVYRLANGDVTTLVSVDISPIVMVD